MLESEMKSGNGSAYIDGLPVMGYEVWEMDYELQRVTGDGYASRESRLLPLAVTDTVYVCKSMCKVMIY